jgi:hypothetical protein
VRASTVPSTDWAIKALGAIGVHATAGAAGGSTYCESDISGPGQGAGPDGIAGQGGQGGERVQTSSTAPRSGRNGLVAIEFLGS